MKRTTPALRPYLAASLSLSRLLPVRLAVCLALVAADAPAPSSLAASNFSAPAQRVPWITSHITGSPEPPPPYAIESAFPRLKFNNPVELVSAPGSDRLFVMEWSGKVFSFPNRAEAAQPDLAVDLKASSKGFDQAYGMVFHPGFQTNRYVFLCYVLKSGLPAGSRVSRFKVIGNDPPRIDPASETILITWLSGGHNGGALQFGPDGFLYISTGDSAAPSPPDPLDTGQDLRDLLSSILRIDVDREEGDRPYRIPPDNPFLQTPGARPEIWAYGFRNPWKMCFDPATGDLWVGDVGWDTWELVCRVERGGNYGWSVVEGNLSIKPNGRRGPTPILPPVAQHSHMEARSITGGFVYHGTRLQDLAGQYIYGDWITGKMWSLPAARNTKAQPREIANTPLQIVCFGQDHVGELYVVGFEGGIYRLIPNPVTRSGHVFPRRLSETGLFASVKDHTPAPGVIPYAIKTELWADSASAERWLAIPGLGQLGVETRMDRMRGWIKGAWTYPQDSVLAKTVSLELERGNPASRRRLETQILHFDGADWHAYDYVWNDEQTDAVLASPAGSERTFVVKDTLAPGGQQRLRWRFSSRTECLICHSAKSTTVLAFQPQQLDIETRCGQTAANQLQTLVKLKLFLEPVKQPALPAPSRPEIAELEQRARAYLQVNCAHCHQTGGASAATFDVRDEVPLDKTKLLNAPPTQGSFGITNAQIIAPGDPFHSTLLYRIAKLGAGRMPHIGSGVVDVQAVRLMRDWIQRLPATESSHTGSGTLGSIENLLKQLVTSTAAGGDLDKTVDQLLSSTAGALALALTLDGPKAPAPKALRDQVTARAAAHPSPAVRDLFERFLPDDQRVPKLGTTIRPEQILSLTGDVVRGRKLFSQPNAVLCTTCHQVGNEGRSIGPDLSQVGKRLDRAAILRSILEPSRDIAPEWVLQYLDANDGTTYTGFVLKRTAVEFVLRDTTGKELHLPLASVGRLTTSQLSLMPEGLLANLTAQEAADLLAFLCSLK